VRGCRNGQREVKRERENEANHCKEAARNRQTISGERGTHTGGGAKLSRNEQPRGGGGRRREEGEDVAEEGSGLAM
jgi:hypothetical protein